MIHNKGKFLLRFGTLALLLAPLAFHATPAAADGWVIECVDCPKRFWGMTDRSLQLDASGWHVETVDSREYVGLYTSLALDGSGYPHISYFDFTNGDLRYAYRDASGWHIQTVDSWRRVGLYTSLALDEDGYPHISYYDDTNGDLKYAYYRLLPYHVYLPIILKE